MKKEKLEENGNHVNIQNNTNVGVAWHATQKAITLISLIITIIILLILAGVALNLTIGENGIFKLAQNAGQNYLNAQEKENSEIAKIEDYIQNSRDTVTIPKEEYEELKKKQPTGIKTDTYLTNKETSTGTYNITSMTGFTKTKDPENKIDEYLEYTADGYKVLKSGWYFITLYSRVESSGQGTDSGMSFTVNSLVVGIVISWTTNLTVDTNQNSFSIYLKKDDLIYFNAYGNITCKGRNNEGIIYPIF